MHWVRSSSSGSSCSWVSVYTCAYVLFLYTLYTNIKRERVGLFFHSRTFFCFRLFRFLFFVRVLYFIVYLLSVTKLASIKVAPYGPVHTIDFCWQQFQFNLICLLLCFINFFSCCFVPFFRPYYLVKFGKQHEKKSSINGKNHSEGEILRGKNHRENLLKWDRP